MSHHGPGCADPSGCAEPPGCAELPLGATTENASKKAGAPRQETHLGWYSRGYLPHFDAPHVIQHVTFRLADALPAQQLAALERELDTIAPDSRPALKRKRIEQLADSGHGCCILRQPWAAQLVQDALLHFDGQRYRLLAWCVMPNHVHVLFEVLPGHPLGRVIQTWRGHTGHQLAPHMPARSDDGTRRVWQRGYWDRYIRDPKHYVAAIQYIENNPVKAGLAAQPEDWPWSSARQR